ncbi:Glycerol-3-phosphate acyltransferase [Thalictrum thalictroides]|uniref:Glycerol-3-phosphate acyltransferase n=1 Tax=Thalictrum thalictroides TaxID=46969 RepID=A0A7J6V0F5_THATH|nr:Glycerol-3-phosphate acyltransferase [Thalictrum thalictroides]
MSTEGKQTHSIVSKLEGNLLISKNTFPYFMIVAFEAGGPLRALILLLISPVLCLLEWLCFETIALQIMIFIALGGLKMAEIKAVAMSAMPRFYLDDIRASAYKVFSSCGGKKYVVTFMPKIMVEAFLQEYLNVDSVFGTELRFSGEYCLGLVAKPGVMVGAAQQGMCKHIKVGFGDVFAEHSIIFNSQEKYIVAVDDNTSPLSRDNYPKPLIFHDGRFVARPTVLNSLAVFMWLPLGIILAIMRLLIGRLLPYKLGILVAAATGMKIRAKLLPKRKTCETHVPYSRCTCESCDPGQYGKGTYTLYVCSHRTLIDPVILATALQRPVTAVTYSVSRISELLSPINTVRLRRDRAKDGETMRTLLKKGDLVVCPEGTTCREPYLLRFSPLFAEIADVIVPVAAEAKSTMFYGTTVRGYKCLDSFFFLMNPNPDYNLQFLEKLSGVRTSEKSSYELANFVQKLIGNALGFQCTNLTRKDKYKMLAGNDGRDTRS